MQHEDEDELFLRNSLPTKQLSFISRQDHCQRFSPFQISDTQQAGYEPEQNLSSGSAE